MLQTFSKIRKVLLFSSDPSCKACFFSLAPFGFSVVATENSGTVIADILSFSPDIICVSYQFLLKAGMPFFRDLVSTATGATIFVVSADDDLTVANWVSHSGARFISGAETPEFLARMLGRCPLNTRQTAENALSAVPPAEFDSFLGDSPHIVEMKHLALRFARSSLPVLICGETGTGKSFFAELFHGASERAGKPFVARNMAEIQDSIAENILFGSVKGGFTSAETRPGLFEAADGGTLFLDEITESSTGVQAKLLRALGQKRIQRVGSNREIDVDVRFITATNRPLPKLVADGSFRQDLYYRVAPLTLTIPPLRERIQDIPLFVNHFVERNGKQVSKGAVHKLLSHTWPGNVRELMGCLERAAVMSSSPFITDGDVAFLPGIVP